MKYYNCELSLKNAEILQEYLYTKNIKFEISACYNLYHFEILLEKDSEDYNSVSKLIESLPYPNF